MCSIISLFRIMSNTHHAHPYRWTYTGQPLVRATPFSQTRRQQRQGRAWFSPRPQCFERVFYPPRPYKRAATQLAMYLAPSGRTLLISDVPDASPTMSSHPQVCQRQLCHGLCPSPVSPSSWGAPSARTIPPTLDRLQLVIDDTVTRMPHLPQHHLPAATPTTQRITPRTGQHALAIGLLRHDAIGPLDQPTQRHHQRCEHHLHLLGLARGMETIIANAMEPFRQNMLHHPTNERQRRDLFLLPLLGLVI